MKNKLLLKTFVYTLVCSMFAGSMPVNATEKDTQVETELDYILGRPMTEEEIKEQQEIEKTAIANSGYIPSARDYDELAVEENPIQLFQALPESYDSRNVDGVSYVTEVKDQNPYGTCWSFAGAACAESDLIRGGYFDNTIDLSEAHLIYFANHSAPDVLGNDYLDEVTDGNSSAYLESGGNEDMVYGTWAAWKGAVEEEEAPYSEVTNGLEPTTEVAYLQDVAHLVGMQYFHKTNMDGIKNAIIEHGAVGASYFHYDPSFHSSAYMNYNTAAYYYYDTRVLANHAITIVGWDDTFSKENFVTAPSEDGAWLVKNSWGSDWADDGYFWISYEDTTLFGFYAFDMEPADNYDNNYQYDFCAPYSIKTVWGTQVASVFEVKANEGKCEQLEAVAISMLNSSNVEYSIQVYKNLKDMSDPTSGTPMLSEPQTGLTTSNGYYTIPLEEKVKLCQGDVFSVVFSFEGNISVDAEKSSSNSGCIATASSRENESYYYNGGWIDYGAEGNGNIRVKAFTTNLDEEMVNCTSVSLDKESASIIAGVETLTLTAEVLPANASNKEVKWSSSNPEVATVDAAGNVTGLSAGTAVITATTFNGGFSASCEVTVATVKVTGISLNKTMLELAEGQNETLLATIVPANASNQNVIWSSSDTMVAKVDENGTVTAYNGGSAIITAQTEDGSYTAACEVTVIVPVTGVSFDIADGEYTMQIRDGFAIWMYAQISPYDATNQNLLWNSSNPEVAVIDNGFVTAVGTGESVITVTTEDGGFQDSCVIIVKKVYPVDIEISQTTATLINGETLQLSASILPTNATEKTIQWFSSNSAIATVDSNGLVKALKPGTVEISVLTTGEDGKYIEAKCDVAVIAPVTGISLNQSNLSLHKGWEERLEATIIPEGAANKNVVWSSSNESVATVDSNGKVTAVDGGTAVITVTTEDGNYTASCLVEVIVFVESVDFEYGDFKINYWGDTVPLKSLTVLPSNATDATLTWESSDPEVVSVDSDGTLTFHKDGLVYITATAVGAQNKSVQIRSMLGVTGITLDAQQLTMKKFDRVKLNATVTPADASNRNVTWTSSNPSVAEVYSSGTVNALSVGETIITVTTEDGNFTASCKVTVTEDGEVIIPEEKVTYVVAYEPNALNVMGTMEKQSITYKSGETLAVNKYTCSGYTFAGWNTKADGTGTAYMDGADGSVFVLEEGEDTVYLYAQWQPVIYDVVLHGNGHTSGSMDYLANLVYDTVYTIPNNAYTRIGYTFMGWNTKADGTGVAYANMASVKNLSVVEYSQVTLYAQWKANTYNVKFNTNGGKGKMTTMTNLSYDKSYKLKKNTLTKKGYTFAGWNTKKNGKGKIYKNKASIKNLTVTNKKTVTLYAQWKPVTYKITYSLNGGKNHKSNPKKFTVATKTITLKKPTKKGYVFKGWYSDKKLTKKVTKIKKGSIGNIKLYAKWVKK